MKKLVKDKRPHGRHGQPDEPCPKDPCHDEDDVVTALTWPDDSKRDFWDLDESVTGIGGRDVSADDPGLLDNEASGHLGLDEEEDEQVEEGWRIQFSPKRGILYSGVVTGRSQRYLFVEMAGNKLSVLKNDPSIKVMEKEQPNYGTPYPCPSASCPDEDKAAKRARKRLKIGEIEGEESKDTKKDDAYWEKRRKEVRKKSTSKRKGGLRRGK